ncbi:MAG: class I SAM-dependent methyltransferase [Nitrososphaerales archaeon]
MNTTTLLAWNLRLQWLFSRAMSPARLEREIPSPWINYNQTPSKYLSEYVRNFKERACLKELPFLIDLGLKEDSILYDYGCGLGRLAYAASKFLGKNGKYIGYEPNAQALSFLKKAYCGRDNFKFYGEELSLEEDYVAVQLGKSRSGGKKSIDIKPQEHLGRVVDIQYSSSVVTHMWMESISRLLENLNYVVKPDGYCVNTWLIIDDFAKYTLECRLADRALPHIVRGAYTYSLENPLVCTAYDLDSVRNAYVKAGHEMVKILWGSWSGRGNVVHYQDIVVSRPRA